MTKEQFNAINAWQQITFKTSTSLSKLVHLKEELTELEAAIKNQTADKRLEFADCFFLLFGAAAADGMSYEDICNAIQEKFDINKTRSWGHPDENGVVKHLEKE